MIKSKRGIFTGADLEDAHLHVVVISSGLGLGHAVLDELLVPVNMETLRQKQT